MAVRAAAAMEAVDTEGEDPGLGWEALLAALQARAKGVEEMVAE